MKNKQVVFSRVAPHEETLQQVLFTTNDDNTILVLTDVKDNKKTCLFSVKNTFFHDKDISPEQCVKTQSEILFRDKGMNKYLTNQLGPAIYWKNKEKDLDVKEYWIDGIRLNDNEAKEMENRTSFNEKFEKALLS